MREQNSETTTEGDRESNGWLIVRPEAETANFPNYGWPRSGEPRATRQTYTNILFFIAIFVTAAIANLVAFEVVVFVETIGRLGFLAALWHFAYVAIVRMKAVVDMAAEVIFAMKPRTRANEHSAVKPFRVVVAIGCAGIRRGVIVAIRTLGGRANFNSDLPMSHCFGGDCQHAASSNSR